MRRHPDIRSVVQVTLQRLSLGMKGFVTIIALSEAGKMKKITLSKRLFHSIITLFVLLPILSCLVFFRNLDFSYRNARLGYLEEQNSSLSTRLEGQMQQIQQLKKEIAQLKDFETKLRAISGLEPSTQPVVGTGDGGVRAASMAATWKKPKEK
jgi:hypothetical protein